MRYILDSNNTVERYGVTLLNVIDNGEPTKAFAKEGVKFSDECEIHGGTFSDVATAMIGDANAN